MLSCLDPRVEPADILGLEPGEAIILRNAGGRVTPEIEEQIAFLGYLSSTLLGSEAPKLEVAIVHHTQCGLGFLADDEFRNGFARHIARDAKELSLLPVVEPAESVRADVENLVASPLLPDGWTVTGHLYDVSTGDLSRVVGA